ncbi:hypothetical protein D3C75_1072680 [compost metagenome]
MQVDRFRAADQRLETAADVQQYRFDRYPFGEFEKQLGQLRFTGRDNGAGKQRLLVVEVAIHREFRHAGGRGDGIHACIGIAVTQKKRLGGIEDGLALGQVLGPARADGYCWVVRHARLNPVVQASILPRPRIGSGAMF